MWGRDKLSETGDVGNGWKEVMTESGDLGLRYWIRIWWFEFLIFFDLTDVSKFRWLEVDFDCGEGMYGGDVIGSQTVQVRMTWKI